MGNVMTFSDALNQLKEGAMLTREGWNGKGLFVMAQFPDENSKMGVPYLYINATALGGSRAPWVPSQTDLFAEDWRMVVLEEHHDGHTHAPGEAQ